KQPQDATVNSALTDLLPYTLIAAEQSIGREEFHEAQRLIALIAQVDPQAPALPRLKSGLETSMKTAANHSEHDAEHDAEQAKKQVEVKAKQAAEQKRLGEQQTREAAAAQQIAAQQEAARQQTAEAE
ncbi:energy transducer TonB, partial [Xanthomonas oryzae pv. oryzae]